MAGRTPSGVTRSKGLDCVPKKLPFGSRHTNVRPFIDGHKSTCRSNPASQGRDGYEQQHLASLIDHDAGDCLLGLGRSDLAAKVEHVSLDDVSNPVLANSGLLPVLLPFDRVVMQKQRTMILLD